jgi:hypothetical protein
MEFFIKKNATLPVLKLQVVKDGRSDYNSFMKTIELSAIFFSMVDVETGIPKISSRPAGFVEKLFEDPNASPEYYIYYQFSNKDTSKVGRYEAQFMMRNDEGVLILPIREKLYINVQDSFIADDLPYESCYVSEFPCCLSGPVRPITTTTTTIPVTTTTTTIPVTTTTTTIPVTPTPSITPTPTGTSLPLFNVLINTVISSGSVIFDFYVTLPHTIDSDYVCDIVKSFNVATGSPIIINTSVFVPSGEISGTTQVVIDEDWTNVSEGFDLLSINQNAENLNFNYTYEIGEIIYNFTPKPNPNITKTPTPTPTLTPTPSITPNPTSSTTPTPTPTPTITPTSSSLVSDLTIYYGKLEKLFMDGTDINLLNNLTTKNIKSKYLSYGMTPGFCYLVVPETLPQPTTFKNSVDGCNGFTVPFARLDDISVVDLYGNIIIYYVYRSFVSTSSSVDIWVCN